MQISFISWEQNKWKGITIISSSGRQIRCKTYKNSKNTMVDGDMAGYTVDTHMWYWLCWITTSRPCKGTQEAFNKCSSHLIFIDSERMYCDWMLKGNQDRPAFVWMHMKTKGDAQSLSRSLSAKQSMISPMTDWSV